MKAIVLAGGRGSRLRNELSISFDLPWSKCLIRIHGKALIEYSLSNILNLYNKGLLDNEIIIVIGEDGYLIRRYIGDKYGSLSVKYVRQMGNTAREALYSARNFVDDEAFFLTLADEILLYNKLEKMLRLFYKRDLDGIVGYVKARSLSSVSKTYSIRLDRNGLVKKLIEKDVGPSNTLKGTGNCVLPYDMFHWIELVDKDDFVSCIQKGIELGARIRAFEVCKEYFNINTLDDLSEAILCLNQISKLL